MADSNVTSYNEDHEATNETAENDLELFYEVSDEIKRIMKEISGSKKDKSAKAKQQLNELRIQGSLHFLTLKKLNRVAQIRCKKIKDSTLTCKQKLEGNSLKLQNLQYEICHLEKEIARCLQFRSKHEDIDMVPENEFYEKASEEVSKPEVTKNNVHKRTLARLDFELEQRKLLEDELSNTQKIKEAVTTEIDKKRQHLQSLQPNLENILKSTLPLQEALGENFTETKKLKAKAVLLPDPLYVLFLQASAYSNAFDSQVQVTIEGDTNEAEVIIKAEKEKKKVAEVEILDVKEDSDSEAEDQDDGEERNRRTSHMETEEKKTSSDEDDILKMHPLHVILSCHLDKNKTDCLTMKFSFLMNLGFITVGASLNMPSLDANVLNNNVLNPTILLSNMMNENDTGLEIPNAAEVAYKVQVNVRTAFKNGERPYMWAQKLAGFDFLSESKEKSSMAISFSNMRRTLQHIQKHVKNRILFAKELNRLEKCEVGGTIQNKSIPSAVQSSLKLWTPILHHQYLEIAYTKPAVELKLISTTDRFYSAKCQRGAASLDVAVSIPALYPSKRPVLMLSLNWRGTKTSANDLNIRAIQADVNHFWLTQNSVKNDILTNQMHRLLVLMDLYLESVSKDESDTNLPIEFPSDKLSPRDVKGRSRRKPLNYNHVYKTQHH